MGVWKRRREGGRASVRLTKRDSGETPVGGGAVGGTERSYWVFLFL